MLNHYRERAPGVDFSGSIGMDTSAHLTEKLIILEEAQSRVQRLKGKAILADARHQLTAAGIGGAMGRAGFRIAHLFNVAKLGT